MQSGIKERENNPSSPNLSRSSGLPPKKRLRKTLASKEIYMKVRSVLILGITLHLGSAAVAQDSPKAEITGDYSYFRLNPGPAFGLE
jgi:hypothetical protein